MESMPEDAFTEMGKCSGSTNSNEAHASQGLELSDLALAIGEPYRGRCDTPLSLASKTRC